MSYSKYIHTYIYIHLYIDVEDRVHGREDLAPESYFMYVYKSYSTYIQTYVYSGVYVYMYMHTYGVLTLQ